MKAEIVKVKSRGDYENEVVVIRIKSDCDIGRFIIADSTYQPNGKVSNAVRHTLWIPDQAVVAGDEVCIWTRSGKSHSAKLTNGNTRYNFYWNLRTAVWNDDGDCAVLFELDNWQFFKVKAVN